MPFEKAKIVPELVRKRGQSFTFIYNIFS